MSEGSNKQEGTPRLSDSLTPGHPGIARISDSPAGKLISNFLVVMNTTGDDAQESYEVALEELRERAEEVVIELSRAERECDKNDYPFRWAIVHIASELRHPASLPFLRNLVMTPIPPERSSEPHSFSTVAEETILRTTAVEGVEFLAQEGLEGAKESLFDFLGQPSISIRRAAVQGILAIGDEKDTQKRVAALLPKDQQYLLDIKRVDVKDVPQIDDPQSHLTELGREDKSKIPPRIPGEPEDDTPKIYE